MSDRDDHNDSEEYISDIEYDSDNNSNKCHREDNGKENDDYKKKELKEAIKTVDERSLFMAVDRYFKKECTIEQLNRMAKIIEKEDKISLRLLNWFSLKYSAYMQGMEMLSENGKIEIFHVKISYKARLKAHSKKYFDPFRRGPKFDYKYDLNDLATCFETTLCQLNFFRWLFVHKLLVYVDHNYDALIKKMAQFEKKKKDIKIKKKVLDIKEKNKEPTRKEETIINIKKFKEDFNVKLFFAF